ncbi:PAS domain S-box protein [bacterium]|nr:PAS domain S-box protein [bacterium]
MKILRDLSIKSKMIAIILSVVFFSIIAGFSINIMREYKILNEKMIAESMMTAILVSEYCITPLDFGYKDEARANLSKLETIPSIFNGCVFDENGNLFASYNRGKEIVTPQIPDVETYSKIEGHWLHIFKEIRFNGEKKGTIYLRISTVDLSERIDTHLLTMIVIGLGMMILAWFLATRLQKIISQPILSLASMTERISRENDYSLRVKKQSNNEIGKLSDSFNEMLEQIHIKKMERDQSEQALRESNRIINRSPAVAFLWQNKEGWPVEFVSANVQHLLDYTAEVFMKGMVFFADLIHADDLENVSEEVQRYSEEKDKTDFVQEYRVVTKHHRIVWIEDHTFIRRNKQGQITHFEGLLINITERRLAEEALRQSEKNFRLLFEHSPLGTYIATTDGIIIDANQSLLKILGSNSIEDTKQINVLTFPPLLENGYSAEFKKCIQTGEIRFIELAYRSNWGKELFLSNYLIPLLDENGNIEKVYTLMEDITERKIADVKVNESEARYRTLVENAPEAIVVLDIKVGKFVDFNENAEKLFKLSREELLKASPISLSPEFQQDGQRSSESSVNAVNKAVAGEIPVFEWTHIDSTGKEIPCEVRLLRLPSTSEILVRGSVIDISRRKQAEYELQHLRNYLSNIINSMPSILVGVDKDGGITQWNNEAERLSGISVENAMGQPLDRLIPHLAKAMEQVREAMRTRKVCFTPKQLRNREDGMVYENITIFPLIANGVEGAVIRIDDVTEQVQLEEMMIQSEKMMSVGGLAAGMAHEINNPLAGILQTLQVILNRVSHGLDKNIIVADSIGISFDDVGKYLQERGLIDMMNTVMDSARRAATIVDNMLSFSRKSESKPVAVNVNELIDKTIDLCATDYDMKRNHDFLDLEIIREYVEDLPALHCESSKIQQVILNILKNGAEAMASIGTLSSSKAAEKGCFIIRTSFEYGAIRLEFEDNGPGMDELTRRRIFEPFFTTKPTNMGTGLGLSVSYFIITENHGGEMWVEAAPAGGTKFVIKLYPDRQGG